MQPSTDFRISCDDAIAAGKVCTHAVTIQQLLDWGIDCEIVLDHLHVPGQARHKAVHQAWLEGRVKQCSLDPAAMRVAPHVQSPESIADALAFARAGKAARVG